MEEAKQQPILDLEMEMGKDDEAGKEKKGSQDANNHVCQGRASSQADTSHPRTASDPIPAVGPQGIFLLIDTNSTTILILTY